MINFNERYYEELVKQSGYKFCSQLNMPIHSLNFEEMSKWFCVFNFPDNIISDISPDNTLIITGIGANKEPHIGTVSQILRILHMQKKGYNVQIILGDLDCYNARGTDVEQVNLMVN